jgi:hypothetical protein
MVVRVVYKGGTVKGVYGAGKEGKTETADPIGWTRDRSHLYDTKTQATVEALQTTLPKDVIGLIVDQAGAKPLTLFSEKSVFPSPVSDRAGYQKGGWVLVDLEGEATVAEVQLEYTRLDGQSQRIVRQIDLAAESDEGMQHAIVLKVS